MSSLSECSISTWVPAKFSRTQRRVRGGKTLAKEERTLALMFILHSVGDVHQPLHAAHAIDANGKSDAGGNMIPILVEGRELADKVCLFWHEYPVG